MRPLKNLIRDEKGSSIVMVMCFALIVLVISGSVIFAASNTWGVQFQREQKKICASYAEDLSARLTEMVTAPMDASDGKTTPWEDIILEVYEQGRAQKKIDVKVEKTTISLPAGVSDGLVINELEIIIENPSMRIVQKYMPEIAPVRDAENNIILAGQDEIPEIALVGAKMRVKLTVKLLSEKVVGAETPKVRSTYTLSSVYTFSGQTENAKGNSGEAKVTSGGWTHNGYYIGERG